MTWLPGKRRLPLPGKCIYSPKNLPKQEEFGLKSQMRRAAVSIASNDGEVEQTIERLYGSLNGLRNSLNAER